jgi:flagellar hook protein FlgE
VILYIRLLLLGVSLRTPLGTHLQGPCMPSTTAIFTGLSGMNANARNIDVIGNNVANVNTTAYKASRMLFSTAISRTISEGSAPGDTTGGSNPYQIGYGVNVAGTQRNFTTGVPTSTGDGRDLTIDGKGFFAVRKDQEVLYTRAGGFRQNSLHQLTTISGERLQGYGVDANFNIVPGKLVDLTAPVGELKLAQATTTARFAGNLDADGTLPTHGSSLTLGSSTTAGFTAIAAAAVPAPDVLLTTTLLTQMEDPTLAGSGTALFTAGQVLQLRSADKGGKTIPTATLDITATTTVADLTAFLEAAMGIDASQGANPDGVIPGVRLDSTTGIISIVGNTGTVNDLVLEPTDLRLLSATGEFIRSPFVPSKAASADGESIRTTFASFDSLGAEVDVDVSFVIDGRDSTGTRWRYYVESGDDTDVATHIATGLIRFDNDGQPINPTPATILIDRTATGATTPMQVSLDFFSGDNGLTSLAAEASELAATYRDGAAIGSLASFSIGRGGVMTGSFTNGLRRTLGQVALATFNNVEGLEEAGGNMYRVAPNSGTALVTTPGGFGTGELIAGSLEASNVDLGDEFTKMILASTGYSASSRVIRTADELLQQLLVLGR